jgi:hypothetical protein
MSFGIGRRLHPAISINKEEFHNNGAGMWSLRSGPFFRSFRPNKKQIPSPTCAVAVGRAIDLGAVPERISELIYPI